MRFFVDVLPGTPAPNGAPFIETEPLFPVAVEVGATEHWMFGGGLESLNGLRGSSILTPGDQVPTFDSNFLTVPSGRNGLRSSVVEPSSYTQCMIMRVRATENGRMLMGTATQSPASGGDNNGVLVSMSSSTGIALNVRPVGNLAVVSSTLPYMDRWIFVAASVDFTNNTRLGYLHGIATAGGVPNTTAFNKSTRTLAYGNSYYNAGTGPSSYTDTVEIAEAIIFPRYMNADAIQEVANRSAVRMAARGIELYTGS